MGAIEKQRSILDVTLSSLGRRKGKNIALIIVYTFVIFLLASVVFFADALKHEATLILQDTPEIIVQRLMAGRQDLIPTHYADSIQAIRGVQSVTPRLWGYYYDAFSGATYTLMVNAELNNHSGGMIVGGGVARRSAPQQAPSPLRKNDLIPFKTYDGSVLNLQVKGFLPSASELVTADLILLAESDFRKIFAFPEHQATDLALSVRNAKERATIATKITQLYPDCRTILRDDILRTYEAVFDWRGGIVLLVLAGGLFAFVILAWDKATGLSGEEKREIGILKAVGWETTDILLMKFWEGATVSLTAFFLGIFFAYLHIFLGTPQLFAPILKGWSVLYPQFHLTPFVSIYQIAVLFFLTVLPYIVATIVPSWRSATIDPDSVMRM
jgi:cell division protein FtsX